MWRKLNLFLLVLLAVSLSLSAFPGRTPSIKTESPKLAKPTVIPEPVLQDPVSPAVPEVYLPEAQKPSEENSEAISAMLSELLNSYEKTSKLSSAELEKLLVELKNIQTEAELLSIDAEEKEAAIAELAALNAKQADDLAYLRGAYDKETATKAFATAGAVLGFRDHVPTYGVSGSLGLRLGKGFLIEAGAQYTIGDIKNPIYAPALDNLAITGSIGWEW